MDLGSGHLLLTFKSSGNPPKTWPVFAFPLCDLEFSDYLERNALMLTAGAVSKFDFGHRNKDNYNRDCLHFSTNIKIPIYP